MKIALLINEQCEGTTHRRFVNSALRNRCGTSVKNGELFEDERNKVKLIKFFAV